MYNMSDGTAFWTVYKWKNSKLGSIQSKVKWSKSCNDKPVLVCHFGHIVILVCNFWFPYFDNMQENWIRLGSWYFPTVLLTDQKNQERVELDF